MNWSPIESTHDVENIIQRSHERPCLILKHSTSCPISSIAKSRLEMNWNLEDGSMEAHYLDLIRYRDVSNFIASEFGVRHESPQTLIIRNGKCVDHASHLAIRVPETA